VQELASAGTQVSVAALPSVIVVGDTVSVRVGAGALTVRETVLSVVPPVPVQLSEYEKAPVVAGVTDCVPVVAFVPLHAPDATHEVEFVLVEKSAEDEPPLSATENTGISRGIAELRGAG
jgi:hypothetical protein